LSFERPLGRIPVQRAFADLENCTVANELSGITEPILVMGLITVKIVRAHGGCLGIWSR
jgi:hypothetical protein